MAARFPSSHTPRFDRTSAARAESPRSRQYLLIWPSNPIPLSNGLRLAAEHPRLDLAAHVLGRQRQEAALPQGDQPHADVVGIVVIAPSRDLADLVDDGLDPAILLDIDIRTAKLVVG